MFATTLQREMAPFLSNVSTGIKSFAPRLLQPERNNSTELLMVVYEEGMERCGLRHPHSMPWYRGAKPKQVCFQARQSERRLIWRPGHEVPDEVSMLLEWRTALEKPVDANGGPASIIRRC